MKKSHRKGINYGQTITKKMFVKEYSFLLVFNVLESLHSDFFLHY